MNNQISQLTMREARQVAKSLNRIAAAKHFVYPEQPALPE